MRNSAVTPAFAHSAATTFFTSASSTAGSIATRALTIRSASFGVMFDGSESFARRVVAHHIADRERARVVHADQLQVRDLAAELAAHRRQFARESRSAARRGRTASRM